MQLLHSLQDVGTESTQILTRLSGHGRHIHLHRSVLDHDDEVAIAAKLRYPLDGLYAQITGDFFKRIGGLGTFIADSAMTVETFDHLRVERKIIFLPLLAHLE